MSCIDDCWDKGVTENFRRIEIGMCASELPLAVFVENDGEPFQNISPLSQVVKDRTSEVNPDWISNCAVSTAVDWAEDNQETAVAVNVTKAWPNLARAAKDIKVRLQHLSYVFGGPRGEGQARIP